MPQLNSSSSAESDRSVTLGDSKNETETEIGPYRRKLRTRAKNQKSESPEKAEEKPEEPEEPEKPQKKPAKKAVKRKQPTEKKSTTKSPKSRAPRKKAGQGEPKSKNVQTKVQQSVVKIDQNFDDDDEDDEDMEEGEIPSSIAAETKTYYSCKLCHKDFSSAFILCLHLQIHQKVANTKVTEEDSTKSIEEDIQNGSIKLEPDADVDENVKTVEEEPEPTVIKVENSPPTGTINKNFVENLKRNLSLAMAKNNS